jgi:hypothetical protein
MKQNNDSNSPKHAAKVIATATAEMLGNQTPHLPPATIPAIPSEGNNGAIIDFSALRLPTNYGETLGVKKMIVRVPINVPNKAEFFRAHPDEAWRYPALIYEYKEESESYLFTQPMAAALPGLVRPVVLHTCIDRRNNPFFLPVPLPNEDGIRNSWHESRMQALLLAETQWVRMIANKPVGGYDVLVARAPLPEPEWPDITLNGLLNIAFNNRIISDPSHPIVRKLMGEV